MLCQPFRNHQIRDLKTGTRVRRFAGLQNPTDESIFRKYNMVGSPTKTGYDLSKFVLGNSHVYKSRYDNQDDHINFVDSEPTGMVASAKPSFPWPVERPITRCASPDFMAGPSGYRFLCLDTKRPLANARHLLVSTVPDTLTKVESRWLLSDIQKWFHERAEKSRLY